MNAQDKHRARAALRLAIARLGGVRKTAKALGITAGAVSRWDICPPARVLDLESITEVPRGDLRPDWYPDSSGGEA